MVTAKKTSWAFGESIKHLKKVRNMLLKDYVLYRSSVPIVIYFQFSVLLCSLLFIGTGVSFLRYVKEMVCHSAPITLLAPLLAGIKEYTVAGKFDGAVLDSAL